MILTRGAAIGSGLAVLLAMGSAGSAQAEEVSARAADCAGAVSVPGEFAGWSGRSNLGAAKGPSDLTKAAVRPRQAKNVSLAPATEVRFAVQGSKTGAPGNGGLLALTIDVPGTYRVGLGSPAWVDLVRDGRVITSSAHGHGPACSGIRKIVDFALEAGVYTVQLSGSPSGTVALMVAQSDSDGGS